MSNPTPTENPPTGGGDEESQSQGSFHTSPVPESPTPEQRTPTVPVSRDDTSRASTPDETIRVGLRSPPLLEPAATPQTEMEFRLQAISMFLDKGVSPPPQLLSASHVADNPSDSDELVHTPPKGGDPKATGRRELAPAYILKTYTPQLYVFEKISPRAF